MSKFPEWTCSELKSTKWTGVVAEREEDGICFNCMSFEDECCGFFFLSAAADDVI